MRKIKLTSKDLDVLNPNITENNLLFISSVLSKISEVISATYGPRAGYVAQVIREHHVGGFSYTKDGMTTLAKLAFNEQSEVDILNMVRLACNAIKQDSGDGSTTGAKLLSNMVRLAASDLLSAEMNGSKEYYNYRINTPKVIDDIANKLENIITENGVTDITHQDIIDVANIATNQDENLVKYFEEISDYIRENNINTKEIEIGVGMSGSDTKVSYNPGFRIGSHNFLMDSTRTQMNNCKIIMLSNTFTIDMLHYVLQEVMDTGNTYTNESGNSLLFIVSGMDNESKRLLSSYTKQLVKKNQVANFDFVEMDYVFSATSNRREDLGYFVNIDEINVLDYCEKRQFDPNNRNSLDSPDNENFLKWRNSVNPNTGKLEEFDGLKKYIDRFYDNTDKGILCTVSYVAGEGLTITPNPDENTNRTLFSEHLAKLKRLATDPDEEIANAAKGRLHYLKENYFMITVADRLGDGRRIFTAIQDAAKAVNSVVSKGYHMGASCSLLNAISQLQLNQPENNTMIEKTANYVINLLKESVKELVEELLPEGKEITDGISLKDYTFFGTRVIAPIRTDITMVKNILYYFSNIYGSLLLEWDNPADAFHSKKVAQDIKDRLEYKKESSDIKPKEDLNELDKKRIEEAVKVAKEAGKKYEANVNLEELSEKKVTEEEVNQFKDIVNKEKQDKVVKEIVQEKVSEPVNKPVEPAGEDFFTVLKNPVIEPEKNPEDMDEFELKKYNMMKELEAKAEKARKEQILKRRLGIGDGQLLDQDGKPQDFEDIITMEDLKNDIVEEEVKKGNLSFKIRYPRNISKEALEKLRNNPFDFE